MTVSDSRRKYNESEKARQQRRDYNNRNKNKRKQYDDSPERRNKRAEYDQSRYNANREDNIQRVRDWKLNNPDKVREQRQGHYERHRYDQYIRAAIYRARRKNQTVGEVDYEKILERDGLTCWICDKYVDPWDIHFDHVQPLAEGGAHSMENIKVAHSRCNLKKSGKVDYDIYEIGGDWNERY
jgi:5-methylcytosine-specific restriction endonuclease McrA